MENQNLQESEINVTPVTADSEQVSEQPAGVPNGTIVTSPAGEQEKIINDLDENGTVVGWHKEIV